MAVERYQPEPPPTPVGDFADIKIASGVSPDAVRGEKVARRDRVFAPEPRLQFTVQGQNRDACMWSMGWHCDRRIDPGALAKFRDEEVFVVIDEAATEKQTL